MHHHLTLLVLSLSLAPTVSAQPFLLDTITPGSAVSIVPDANGDGEDDILIGAPNVGAEGRAYLLSGPTREILLELELPASRGNSFGDVVAGVPDTDGDGRGDLLIAGNPESGACRSAYLFSGATGEYLFGWDFPECGFPFPLSLAGVPDTNGDGHGDILVGNPNEEVGDGPFGGSPEAGRTYLYSGSTGELLFTLDSPANNDFFIRFGFSVAGVSDIDGDGRGDLLIGAPQESGSGRVYLYSGATGSVVDVLASPNTDGPSSFGSSIASVPDTDGDGRDDLLVGARAENPGDSPDLAGRAYLFSGSDRTLLLEIAAPDEERNQYFGNLVSGVTDADSDGRGDLLIADYSLDFGLGNEDYNAGVYLFSGSTGDLIFKAETPDDELSFFGLSISGAPDTNGDGHSDILIGSASRTYLYSGNPKPVTSEPTSLNTNTRSLRPAFPNPFARSTTLDFTLAGTETVRLVVYDLLGREVARLADGPMAAGEHTVTLDGAALPTGSYVVRLEAEGRLETQRITLVR